MVDLEKPASAEQHSLYEIRMRGRAAFIELEQERPGTLLNNCSHALWRRRYVQNVRKTKTTNPLDMAEPLMEPWSSLSEKEKHRHISQWAIDMRVFDKRTLLFGCTEDVTCTAPGQHTLHDAELNSGQYVRRMCPHCAVPVCHDCWSKLYLFKDSSTIPMSLSNDHYYGYVNRFLVDNRVTWLECAAASVCWSTMLVYYLEDPYGHLMAEPMGKPQSRTKVKGNLFSFNMPWEDIEKCCHSASLQAKSPQREELQQLQEELGLPHSEEVLEKLVNVHIRFGNKDLTAHLKGLTMRVAVVQGLVDIMRSSGYHGYEAGGVNAPNKVAQRLKERYTDVYGQASFIPAAVLRAVNVQNKSSISIVQEKHATPAEAAKDIREWDKTLRPQHIVAERSVQSQGNVHENYKHVFAKYSTFEIESGTKLTEQFLPWYIGMAFPFTLPLAVGGYDVPFQSRWRRPEDEDVPYPRATLPNWLPGDHGLVGPACKVRLFDITRGLPQRIEGQFRQHWGLTPALWNLYFREQINLGISLSVNRQRDIQAPDGSVDEDAAMAAAALLEKLEKGYYLTNGKRRKINGDFSKLIFAERLSPLQRKVLTDFRFRCNSLPGTQEIRVKIGHLGFWASVAYGNGIFITVSPGERHNYLAIRVSRYRGLDPCLLFRDDGGKWAAKDKPSLEPNEEDEFYVEIPGYDLRRLLQAEDPLAAANAFVVQIRVILATVLGIRMCPHCPHCSNTEYPCQDAMGSNAELMGGLAGRADALFGAVECQKSNGSLHFHFFAYVQRVHQYATMKEIAELLEKKLVDAADLKHFLSNICCESYADVEKHQKEVPLLEEHFPTYSENTECAGSLTWGRFKLGRLPRELYADAEETLVIAEKPGSFVVKGTSKHTKQMLYE